MSQQSKKLNIAIFHPSLMNRGGSQRYAIETAIHLRKHGCNVDLITSKFSPDKCYPELLVNFPVSSVHTYPSAGSIRSSLRFKRSLMYYLIMITGLYALVRIARDWMQNRKVASLISSLEHQNNADFDIIYLHESTSFNYLAKCLNSARRRVYLFCYDTPDKFLSWEMEGLKLPWVHASIERLLHMRDIGIVRTYIKKIFVLDSTMVKKCKMFYGITPDIIHGGIDLDVFNFTKSNFLIERYKLPENSLIISNVSRFVPYRRLHDIFEAYSQTNIKDKSKIFIYINAYDQDQQYTYELLKKYKDLIFPRGKVIIDHEFPSNDRELAQIYKSSDGFIFPNEKQTWGNAVLEAMACGVCVMVSDSCGISEIVNHGDNGLIYRCGDITEISAFISRIASQGDDSMLIGLRAAEHIKRNFSWKVWTDNHIVYFEQAI